LRLLEIVKGAIEPGVNEIVEFGPKPVIDAKKSFKVITRLKLPSSAQHFFLAGSISW
jgi:hypothetical protein